MPPIKSLTIGNFVPRRTRKGVQLPPYPHRPHVAPSELSTLERCLRLPRGRLPSSLESLVWNGKISVHELGALSECSSLTSLTLDCIIQQFYVSWTLHAVDYPSKKHLRELLETLPPSLLQLHILGCGNLTHLLSEEAVIMLPPGITDLKLVTYPLAADAHYTQHFQRLPLTRLNLNAPHAKREDFPNTITDLNLKQ